MHLDEAIFLFLLAKNPLDAIRVSVTNLANFNLAILFFRFTEMSLDRLDWLWETLDSTNLITRNLFYKFANPQKVRDFEFV